MIREKILKFKNRFFSNFGQKKERLLLGIIKCGIYLSLLTPLVFSKNFFPPPLPPTIFFRLVVDAVLIAYIALSISSPNYRPKFNFLTIAVSLFLGVIILTSFTGVNFEKSIWGNFDRMGGAITFIHLFGFFIILSSVFKDRKDWERIFIFSILIGILVVLLALFNNQFSFKNGGTLWNSSFFASYLLFNIYFAIILLLTKRGVWRIFYGTSAVVLLSALFLSGCRGAIVSFFISLFIFALGYCIFFKRKLLKWFVLGVFLISIIFISILLFTKSNLIKNESKIILDSPSLQARFIVWKISWEGWKERFLFGWGPENFDVAFFKYFSPELSMAKYGGQVIFDRAHNIILDIGVTSGILGVLSYLTIFVTAFLALFKKSKEFLRKDELMLFLGIVVILIVYFLQNLLVLDTINSYIMFFLILGFISSSLGKNKLEELREKETNKKYICSCLGAVLIIFVILTTYFGNIQPARASFYIGKAKNIALKESIPLFQKSFRIHTISQLDGSKYLYDKVIQSLFSPNINRGTLKIDLQIIEEELEKNIKKNPLDFYLHLQSAGVYADSFNITRDGGKLVLAESVLRKAIALSPENPRGYQKLADVMFSRGKYEEQFKLLKKVVDLEPRIGQSYFDLVLAYALAGEEELAREGIDDIEKNKSKFVGGTDFLLEQKNIEGVIRINQFFDSRGSIGVTKFLFDEIIRKNPENFLSVYEGIYKNNPNMKTRWLLFLAHLQLGKFDEIEDAIAKDPGITEAGRIKLEDIIQKARDNYKNNTE